MSDAFLLSLLVKREHIFGTNETRDTICNMDFSTAFVPMMNNICYLPKKKVFGGE